MRVYPQVGLSDIVSFGQHLEATQAGVSPQCRGGWRYLRVNGALKRCL